jgi:hypothetical protein
MQAKECSVHARLVFEFALSWTSFFNIVYFGCKPDFFLFFNVIKLVLSFRLHNPQY